MNENAGSGRVVTLRLITTARTSLQGKILKEHLPN